MSAHDENSRVQPASASDESFEAFWQDLRSTLESGAMIQNWTTKRGYLGDAFTVTAVTDSSVVVDAPSAEATQQIPKKDVEVVFSQWKEYSAGHVQRQALRDITRFSKYIISIIKHLEGREAQGS